MGEFGFCIKAEVELVKQDTERVVVNAVVVLLPIFLVVRNVLTFVIIKIGSLFLFAYFSTPSEADEHCPAARLVVHYLPGHNLSVCDPRTFVSLVMEHVYAVHNLLQYIPNQREFQPLSFLCLDKIL